MALTASDQAAVKKAAIQGLGNTAAAQTAATSAISAGNAASGAVYSYNDATGAPISKTVNNTVTPIGPINSTALNQTPTYHPPTPAPATNLNANAMTALSAQNSVYQTALTTAAAAQDKATNSTSGSDSLASQLALLAGIPKKEDIQSNAQVSGAHDQVMAAQNQTNQDTALLNAIIMKQNQDLLQTRGTASANGVTEAVYGGIANEINREAAIQSLPIAAKIAIDQGNLKQAQDNLEWLTSVVKEKVNNAYDYEIAKFNSISSWVTKSEAATLDAKKTATANNVTVQNALIKQAGDIAQEAAKNGNGVLAQRAMKAMTTIAGLNPSSATYQSDVLSVRTSMESLVGGLASSSAGTKAPEVKSINGVDMQWNPKTARWETPTTDTTTTTSDVVQKSKEQVNLLLTSIGNAEKKADYSGQSGFVKNGIGFFTGPGNYGDLEAQTNTIRTNILTLATDPAIKKFFGPQMSNADVQLMTAAGTTLNPELQSPKAMKEELTRLKDFSVRAKMSLEGASQFGLTPTGIRVGLMPDGTIRDVDGNRYDANGDKL